MNARFLFALRIAICLTCMGFLCHGSLHADSLGDAVVTIWAKPKSGSPWVGTGFFLSKDGEVLTCYHVIRNAQTLTIYRGKEAYSDVQVEAISPEHDLALLRVNNVPPPIAFLELSRDPPAQFLSGQLTVYGYLAGQLQQKLSASPTSMDYVLSGSLRSVDGGDRIFRLPAVKLISLQMTVFNGFSGGPVLSSDKVVGIISGSYSQGGTIAWAIPAIYASLGQMSSIGQLLSQVQTWPALSLMQEGPAWNTLRQGLSLSAGLSLALDAYVASLDACSGSFKDIMTSVHELDDATVDLLKKGDLMMAAKKNGEDPTALRAEFHAAHGFLERRLMSLLLQALSLQTCNVQIAQRIHVLDAELNHYFKTLPQTPRNKEVAKRARKQINELSLDITHRARRYHKSSKVFQKSVKRLNAGFDRVKDPPYEVRKTYLTSLRVLWDDFLLNKSQSDITSMIASFRAIGDVSDALLDLAASPTNVPADMGETEGGKSATAGVIR